VRPCVREEVLEEAITSVLEAICFTDKEQEKLNAYALGLLEQHERREGEAREVWKFQLGALEARENRLVDAYLEGALDRDNFEKRKKTLLFEKRDLEDV
jgi:site-specific DNA recombinase